jgi:aryl-alcohol dehydrogenase-like predicted oxidoreductase
MPDAITALALACRICAVVPAVGRERRGPVSGAIAEVAARHQATPAQVAITWLLARTPV